MQAVLGKLTIVKTPSNLLSLDVSACRQGREVRPANTEEVSPAFQQLLQLIPSNAMRMVLVLLVLVLVSHIADDYILKLETDCISITPREKLN